MSDSPGDTTTEPAEPLLDAPEVRVRVPEGPVVDPPVVIVTLPLAAASAVALADEMVTDPESAAAEEPLTMATLPPPALVLEPAVS